MPLTVIAELLRLIGRYRWTVPGLVLLGLAASLSEALAIGLIIPFAAEVLNQDSFGAQWVHNAAATYGQWVGLEGTSFLAVAILVLITLKALLAVADAMAGHAVKARAAHELRLALFERILRMDYGQFLKTGEGDHLNIVAGETWRVTEAIDNFFAILSRLATILVFAAFLCFLSWELTLSALAVVALGTFLLRFLAQRSRALGALAVKANTRLSGQISNVLGGMRTVRAFVQEEREREKLAVHSEDVRRTFYRMDIIASAIHPMLEAVYLPFFLGALWIESAAGVGAPLLLTFLLIAFRIIPPIRDLEQRRLRLAGSAGAVDAVMALLRTPVPPPHEAGPTVRFEKAIRFEDVTFAYPGDRAEGFALDDVSFEIWKGSTFAIVGTSGSGKSTLVNLLLGFYAPQSGSIDVDGAPLETLDLAAWRRSVGFAGQDSRLFAGTIAENIAYGRPEAFREEIEEAARAAHAHDFIEGLPHGYDTWIGGDGSGLSGGQRQRIALARALLIDPELLILDEATNAVDNVTEAQLRKTLAGLQGKKTIIIIAHRMSTVRHADWIIAMDDGRVVEQGPPADLLKRNAAFARLYQLEMEAASVASGR